MLLLLYYLFGFAACDMLAEAVAALRRRRRERRARRRAELLAEFPLLSRYL